MKGDFLKIASKATFQLAIVVGLFAVVGLIAMALAWVASQRKAPPSYAPQYTTTTPTTASPTTASPSPASPPPDAPERSALDTLLFGASVGANTLFSRLERFTPPIEPVDTRTFEANGKVISFANIETPGVHAVCRAQDKSLWGCGIMARAALFNRIRKGALHCRPVHRPGSAGISVSTGWHCLHDGQDVALWMIASGWARPQPGSPLDYGLAAAEAQAARRGLWNGDWSIVRQDLKLAPDQDIAPPEPAPPDTGPSRKGRKRAKPPER